jgi:hypothetical protein
VSADVESIRDVNIKAPNNEHLRYVGEYERDQKSGQGVFYWPDGRSYNGQWQKDCFHGEGVFTNSKGEGRRGVWRFGKRVKWIGEGGEADWGSRRASVVAVATGMVRKKHIGKFFFFCGRCDSLCLSNMLKSGHSVRGSPYALPAIHPSERLIFAFFHRFFLPVIERGVFSSFH